MSLFKKAEAKSERLKLYIYGPTGTGKTVTALHFPNPAVVDTEKGTVHYGKYFDFHRLEANSINLLHKGLDELLNDPGDFKTFIVDSMSDIYDSIINEREAYLRKKTGNMAYELQPRDYSFIKKQVRLLITKILALDMNIIVTARAKDLYSEKDFMQKIGITADGHKEMPYKFDVVLELQKDENGKRWAVVEKDRTNTLPHKFEFNYETFSNYLDIEGLQRKAVAFNQRKAIDEARGRTHEITLPDGTKRKTAGIEANTVVELQKLLANGSDEELVELLRAEYGVESVMDLTDGEGQALIKYLKALNN